LKIFIGNWKVFVDHIVLRDLNGPGGLV
jgi:hypothetical protein